MTRRIGLVQLTFGIWLAQTLCVVFVADSVTNASLITSAEPAVRVCIEAVLTTVTLAAPDVLLTIAVASDDVALEISAFHPGK